MGVPTTVTVASTALSLPDSSRTRMVTALSPNGATLPAAGDWLTTSAADAEQSSLATTDEVKSGTSPLQS